MPEPLSPENEAAALHIFQSAPGSWGTTTAAAGKPPFFSIACLNQAIWHNHCPALFPQQKVPGGIHRNTDIPRSDIRRNNHHSYILKAISTLRIGIDQYHFCQLSGKLVILFFVMPIMIRPSTFQRDAISTTLSIRSPPMSII